MTPFKFFRGYSKIGTLNTMDGMMVVTGSISIYNPYIYWAPEESERQRIERMRISNELYGEMSQAYEQNRIRQQQRRLAEQVAIAERISQNLTQIEGQQYRLFQATSTITVNPSLWNKIKIFGTRVKLVLKECWHREPIGLAFVTILMFITMVIFFINLFIK
jgi:hypothetical protein